MEKNSGRGAEPRYAIGIDLGTTNTELAYCDLSAENGEAKPRVFEIPQFVDQNVIEALRTLPSNLYIGEKGEKEAADWRLPWDRRAEAVEQDASEPASRGKGKKQEKKKGIIQRVFGIGRNSSEADGRGTSDPDALYLTGEIASRRAAEFPEKTVSSAKSWLSYSKVDRRKPILPNAADKDAPKVSPVEASRRYLAHLVAAWNDALPDAPIADQLVVVAVPASFDESARELTREAAVAAGLNPETFLFIEEPQAALYAWLAKSGDKWRRELKVGDVILVCDVGGGTTDLSLIRVEEEEGDLVLNRLAVGDRLLLGGDNIDLALAVRASQLFADAGVKLNPWQSGALCRQCREAKEALLSGAEGDDPEGTFRITIAGRSSKLVGEAASTEFPKKDALNIAVDGFFPLCDLTDRPARRSGFGLRETGLPYEADPAVTRHVARFLNSRADAEGVSSIPTKYLLNGGVFRSEMIAKRFDEQLARWYPDAVPSNLSPDADLVGAASLGAAYYAAVKTRGGVRIRGASARSYYIGIESSGLAIPGMARPLKALCVAPSGMEEGEELDVPSGLFELVVGEPALFRFFSSASRPQDRPGDVLDYYDSPDGSTQANDDGLEETDPVETSFNSGADSTETSEAEDGADPEYVAVRFHTVITELGALEIWCEEAEGDRRWKLEFSVRED